MSPRSYPRSVAWGVESLVSGKNHSPVQPPMCADSVRTPAGMRVACAILFVMGLIGWPLVYLAFLIDKLLGRFK